VQRPRLIERLDAGLREACKLILMSAPAGFGKATLLNDWLHGQATVERGRLKTRSHCISLPVLPGWPLTKTTTPSRASSPPY
jgi:hypothetical protein